MKKLLKAPVGVQLCAFYSVLSFGLLCFLCFVEPLIFPATLTVLLLLLAVFTVADWWWDNR